MGLSEAGRLLPGKLAAKRWSQGELTRRMAADLGHVADGLVNRWTKGTREPSASQSAWMDRHLGLKARLWGVPARRMAAGA